MTSAGAASNANVADSSVAASCLSTDLGTFGLSSGLVASFLLSSALGTSRLSSCLAASLFLSSALETSCPSSRRLSSDVVPLVVGVVVYLWSGGHRGCGIRDHLPAGLGCPLLLVWAHGRLPLWIWTSVPPKHPRCSRHWLPGSLPSDVRGRCSEEGLSKMWARKSLPPPWHVERWIRYFGFAEMVLDRWTLYVVLASPASSTLTAPLEPSSPNTNGVSFTFKVWRWSGEYDDESSYTGSKFCSDSRLDSLFFFFGGGANFHPASNYSASFVPRNSFLIRVMACVAASSSFSDCVGCGTSWM